MVRLILCIWVYTKTWNLFDTHLQISPDIHPLNIYIYILYIYICTYQSTSKERTMQIEDHLRGGGSYGESCSSSGGDWLVGQFLGFDVETTLENMDVHLTAFWQYIAQKLGHMLFHNHCTRNCFRGAG